MRILGAVAAAALSVAPAAAGGLPPSPNPGPGFSHVSNYGPAWSPDGSRIAFATYAAGHAQIASTDTDGSRVLRLTHDSYNDFSPRWRGDGRLLFRGQARGEAFVATLDARGRTVRLPLPGRAVDFSPDGKRIAYQVEDPQILQYQLWVANADGTDAHMLVANAGHDGADPRWSPDGTRIAYAAGANTDFRTIHVIDADGTHDREVTTAGHEWQWDWSPDGRRLVYAEGPYAQPRYNLAVIDADGTNRRELTKPASWSDYLPAWSPDGAWIAFTSSRSGRDEIWVMRADGTQQHRLTFGGCTRIGTRHADVLAGGAGRDVLCGFDGDDVLRGAAGNDVLVGGPGNDRLAGGVDNDVLYGEQGDDVLVAGTGSDSLDGGADVDTGFADSHDTLRSIEHAHGGRIVVPEPLPTAAALETTTRAAAAASRAKIVALDVRVPALYSLAVRVDDPAAYLRHRANTLLDPVLKAIRPVRFTTFRFSARDSAGVFLSYSATGGSSTWFVRPGLANCALAIDLEIEVTDNGDPPCPAP